MTADATQNIKTTDEEQAAIRALLAYVISPEYLNTIVTPVYDSVAQLEEFASSAERIRSANALLEDGDSEYVLDTRVVHKIEELPTHLQEWILASDEYLFHE